MDFYSLHCDPPTANSKRTSRSFFFLKGHFKSTWRSGFMFAFRFHYKTSLLAPQFAISMNTFLPTRARGTNSPHLSTGVYWPNTAEGVSAGRGVKLICYVNIHTPQRSRLPQTQDSKLGFENCAHMTCHTFTRPQHPTDTCLN